jgi:hypothetical protein
LRHFFGCVLNEDFFFSLVIAKYVRLHSGNLVDGKMRSGMGVAATDRSN